MTTSASWTLFDPAEVPEVPIAGHDGLLGQALVDNTDEGGSSLLRVRYEPGAGDPERRHAVGQVFLVLEGELTVEGRRCGPLTGGFAPADHTYPTIAGAEGAVVYEFRPAPIAYGRKADDDATAHVQAPTEPTDFYVRTWEIMGSAGPVTSVKEFSYFDINTMEETRVGPELAIQSIVNHREDDGQSVIMNHHVAGGVQAVHSHDVDQIVVVIDGTALQGNRRFPVGAGFFTPKGKKYGFRASPDADMRRVEWRPGPLRFATDFVDDVDLDSPEAHVI